MQSVGPNWNHWKQWAFIKVLLDVEELVQTILIKNTVVYIPLKVFSSYDFLVLFFVYGMGEFSLIWFVGVFLQIQILLAFVSLCLW